MNNQDILVYIFDSDLKQYFQDSKVNLIDFANFWIINLYKKHNIDVVILDSKYNNNTISFNVILKMRNKDINVGINFSIYDFNSYDELDLKQFCFDIVSDAYNLIKNTFVNVYPEYKDEPIDQSKRNEIEDLIFRKIANIYIMVELIMEL